MKKYLVILFIFVFFMSTAEARTIKAGVTYTFADAKRDAFKGVSKKININKYGKVLKDPFYEENKMLLKLGKNEADNRYIIGFSIGGYAYAYKKAKTVAYYYTDEGDLENIGISSSPDYPKRTIKYDIKGILSDVAIELSDKEQFVFDADKKLIGHWIKNNCYNEKGELIMTRE